MPAFAHTLSNHGLELVRAETTTLQVNVGLLCNQACRHCHLDAGPTRSEIMAKTTMNSVISYAARVKFTTIDITGGAPELVPDLPHLLKNLAPLTEKLILRTNLTALHDRTESGLVELCRAHRITITASFPATDPDQTAAMRGPNVFSTSLAMLRKLNELDYGLAGSGLELNLVANPTGAYLPASQCQVEMQFKETLQQRWGISFNHLYTFANAPLGRYRQWLLASGNFDQYMASLHKNFNPAAFPGLMCRNLVSIAADGWLYDCDFNLAAGLPIAGRLHVENMAGYPRPGAVIATGDHCYACTAGSGFT